MAGDRGVVRTRRQRRRRRRCRRARGVPRSDLNFYYYFHRRKRNNNLFWQWRRVTVLWHR